MIHCFTTTTKYVMYTLIGHRTVYIVLAVYSVYLWHDDKAFTLL